MSREATSPALFSEAGTLHGPGPAFSPPGSGVASGSRRPPFAQASEALDASAGAGFSGTRAADLRGQQANGRRLRFNIRATKATLVDTVKVQVRQEAAELSALYGGPMRCAVTVEPVRGDGRGQWCYDVRVDLSLPDNESAVGWRVTEDLLPVAIRNSFDAARLRLRGYRDPAEGGGPSSTFESVRRPARKTAASHKGEG